MKKGFIAAIIMILFMAACSAHENQGDVTTEGALTTLVLAVFEESPELNRQIALFNENNNEYNIEIKMYERSTQLEIDGRTRLQREILSGKGPDMIDFGTQYTTSDIVGGYTENLLPYLKSEMGQRNEEYFLNILEAFCYKDECLYAMPAGFTMQTFAGSKEVLCNREHWNIQEMMTFYQEKEDEMILYPGQTKTDVFATILTGSMEYYIDWENGTCSFDGEEFKKVMSFANSFPDELQLTDDFSVKRTFFNGEALLLPLRIRSVFDICKAEYIFNEQNISYVGFPVEGTSGTIIVPSYPMLAISISSGQKDACWEFISQFLDKQYQSEMDNRFPICRSALEERLLEDQTPEYTVDAEGNQKPIIKSQVIFEGEEPEDIYNITEDQAETLIHLIESASISNSTDYQLYNIIYEEAQVYFMGGRTLEEAAEVIQNRAVIYVSERAK